MRLDEELARLNRLVDVPLRRKKQHELATADSIIAYARAIGSRNPLYSQYAYGQGTFIGSLAAHPTYLVCVDSGAITVGLSEFAAAQVKSTWTFMRYVRVGDRLSADARLKSTRPVTTAFAGAGYVQTGEVVFRNQHGFEVADLTVEHLRFQPEIARSLSPYRDRKRHRYSTDEIEAIMAAYEAEEIRGEDPRYWENVSAGDSVGSIVRGPLTSEDVSLYVGAVGDTLFFREFVDFMDRHPRAAVWDDDGFPDLWQNAVINVELASACGFGLPMASSRQRSAWAENLVTNWMGDLALLRQLRTKLLRQVFYGDTVWLDGVVVDKSIVECEGVSKYAVAVKVDARNQFGELVAVHYAEVWCVSHCVETFPPVLAFPPAFEPFRGPPKGSGPGRHVKSSNRTSPG
jgi:acyl dehydratase